MSIAKLEDPGQVLKPADWWLVQEDIATIASQSSNVVLVARGSSRRAMQVARKDLLKSEYKDGFELGQGVGPTHLLTSSVRSHSQSCLVRVELVDLASGLVTSSRGVDAACEVEALRIGMRQAITGTMGIKDALIPTPEVREPEQDVLLRLVDGLAREFDLGFKSKAFAGRAVDEPEPAVVARVIDTPCPAIAKELFADPQIRFGESKEPLESQWIKEGSPVFLVSETSAFFRCQLNDVPNPQAAAAAASMVLRLRSALGPGWAEQATTDGATFTQKNGQKRLVVGYVKGVLFSGFVLVLTGGDAKGRH